MEREVSTTLASVRGGTLFDHAPHVMLQFPNIDSLGGGLISATRGRERRETVTDRERETETEREERGEESEASRGGSSVHYPIEIFSTFL
jgi:hypothetical protein